MPVLRVKSGWAPGTEFTLGHEPVQIGRSRAAGVRLEASGVSRLHARINPDADGWVLEDADSRHGVTVNGKPVKTWRLADGDEIGIGAVTFTYHQADEPDDAHAGDEGDEAPASIDDGAGAMPQPTPADTDAGATPSQAPTAPAAPVAERGVNDGPNPEAVARMQRAYRDLREELGKVIVGQADVVEQILTAMLARGHCLMVGVPGLAKTLMVRTLSQILSLDFHRVQFTPDLMPSDITGTDILEVDEVTGEKRFRFVKGPIFTNMLLADEINRTPPKTQAALLEAMQEHSVTASGYTYRLEEPFFVLATQNPLEQEGTYPLPEAQLDRFMFNILVGYPSEAEEEAIVKSTTHAGVASPKPVLSGAEIVELQDTVWRVGIPDSVIRYATSLVRGARPGKGAPEFINRLVQCGAGPRACQYLVLGAKAHAVLDGRTQATIKDVMKCAVPVLRHRIFLNFNALSEGVTSTQVIAQLAKTIPVPDATASPPIVRKFTAQAPAAQKELESAPPAEGKAAHAVQAIRQMRVVSARVRDEVHKIIIGQEEVIELLLTALLAGGHCLLVGVPGLAKTLTVRTLADVLDLDFNRVQFTPDLMPSDITGADILEEDETTGEKTFRFIKGPIFANLLLADEINRTPPKTQAALLEAMQEKSVTIGGTSYPLNPPFFVLATQNPLEQEGTYPLPEAQLDRFMFNLVLDYPDELDELVVVKATTQAIKAKARKVIGGKDINALQKLVRQVPVSDHVVKYATRLVRATRPENPDAPDFIKSWVYCGAGPRACQNMILGAKARAVMQGRINVGSSDVRACALAILRHRIFTNFNADSEGVTAADIVARLLKAIPEPTGKDYAPAPGAPRSTGFRKAARSAAAPGDPAA